MSVIAKVLSVVVLSVAGSAAAQTRPTTRLSDWPTRAPTTRPDQTAVLAQLVEEVAAKLPFLSPKDVVYDRPPFSGRDAATVGELWQSLRERPNGSADAENALKWNNPWLFNDPHCPGPWTAEEIRPLLTHADAKVRTLGLALLYQLNRVDLLPEFAPLAFDEADTIPGLYFGMAIGQ